MSGIAAVILAAGRATRFGSGATTKVTAELSGVPLVRRVAMAALASRARPVIVVTGHAAGQTSSALEECDVEIVHSADYGAGLAHSLRAGLAVVPAAAAGAIILLADMPLVSNVLIDRLISAFEASAYATAVIPTYDGRRGNPVLIARALFAELMELDGDRGASQILSNAAGVVECPVADPAIFADIDTPDDLLAVRARGA